MVTAYVGFGANLGDPVQQILDARRQLSESLSYRDAVHSSLYLTSPIGYQDQSDFVNSVSAYETDLSANDFLDLLQHTENKLGRQRDPANQSAPRLIDLDILIFGEQVINEDRLIIPHPRIEQRLFTLEPLSEIAPNLSWKNNSTVTDILTEGYSDGRFDGQTIFRLT